MVEAENLSSTTPGDAEKGIKVEENAPCSCTHLTATRRACKVGDDVEFVR